MNLPPPDLPPDSTRDSDEPPPRLGAYRADAGNDEQPAKVLTAKPKLVEAEKEPESVVEIAMDAIRYPLRGSGWATIVPGAILAGILTFTVWIPISGWLVFLGGACYMSAFYFRIVETTVLGRNRLPDWPEFSDMIDDVILPGCQMFAIYLLALVPTILLVIFSDLELESESQWLGFADLFIMGSFALYFPMAVLSLVHFGTFGSVLYHRVAPAIFRCLPGYLLPMGAVLVEMLLNTLVSSAVAGFSVLGTFISWLAIIYLMVFSGRVTGLFYRQHRGILGW